LSDQVLEKLESIENRIEDLENTVKGGNQPENKIYVSANDHHGQTPVIKTLIKEAKKGGKHDGLETGQVAALLQKEGHDRSRQAVLDLMRRMEQEYRPAKFKKGKSNQASRLLWIP